jgi:hypothetical protein
MSQTWVCHSAESGRFCASGDRPDRAPAGCSYGYLSGRVPRMLLGCLGCRKRPKVSSQATCLDFVEVAIHSDRHRYGAAESDPAFEPIEAELAKQPVITGPAIVLHGDSDGVSPPRSSERHDRFFTGPYEQRVVPLHSVPARHWHRFPYRCQLSERAGAARWGAEGLRARRRQRQSESIPFLPNCGTTLYWEGDRNPAVSGVAVGAFDIPASENSPMNATPTMPSTSVIPR